MGQFLGRFSLVSAAQATTVQLAQVYMLQASFIWIFDLILLYALVLDP